MTNERESEGSANVKIVRRDERIKRRKVESNEYRERLRRRFASDKYEPLFEGCKTPLFGRRGATKPVL